MQEQERGREQAALRSTPGRAQADEWALVLMAEGLSPHVERSAGAFVISVPLAERERACASLAEYDFEQISNREPIAIAEDPGSTWAYTVSFGITSCLLCFFAVTGERSQDAFWFVAGRADANLILAGEFWRCVTALTLHADMPHVVGNALFGTLFLGAVFRVLGPGLGGAMVLASGIGGNLANAFLHESVHSSVGASTAIFGAIGLLGGLGVMRRRSHGGRGFRAWAPWAAGLALLAMIGTSARADVAAHLLGLAFGWVLGALSAQLLSKRPALAGQWALGGASLALIAGCWEMALR